MDIYNRLIHDQTLNIDLNNVYIGYSDKVFGDQEKRILDWIMINDGGDIPMHHILYFVFILNNQNRLILWDRKTKLDRLFGSGITKKHQTFHIIINSEKIKQIQSQNKNDQNYESNSQNHVASKQEFVTNNLFKNDDNKIEEKKENNNDNDKKHEGLCKFYGAGYCRYGPRCNSLHDGDEINKYEQEWINGKIVINNQEIPLITLPKRFSIERITKQKYDYILVLDLEGKDEIIELPCILIDLSLMKEVGRFHAWIRPTQWNNNNGYIPIQHQQDIKYINRKSRAVSFPTALQSLNIFLNKYGIILNKKGEFMNNSKSFLSAICGNWDIKTQIPKQCKICNIELPLYFNQWMNIKDFALSVYPQYEPYQVKGMASLLRTLRMKLYGTHHLGMDDTYNISRLIIKFIIDNNKIIYDYTAYRNIYNGRIFYKNNNRRVSRYHTSSKNNKKQNNYFQYRR